MCEGWQIVNVNRVEIAPGVFSKCTMDGVLIVIDRLGQALAQAEAVTRFARRTRR
jgi:hypothetical protein